MAITVNTAGEFNGKRVDEALLVSDTGAEIALLNWGVTVRDWRVPVAGGLRSVVLGFETFDPYPEHSPHFGSLAGRVANRIAGAQFTLEGQTYHLPENQTGSCLHGGPEGLGRQVWDMEIDEAANAVRFTHFSPDGAMGFPGNVNFEAVYTLKGNALSLELSAMPDRPTPISLVQHQYFNLGTTETILDHTVETLASAYSEVDENLVPTGALLPVYGTQYDLRKPRTLRDDAGNPLNYDVNLVLPTARKFEDPLAIVTAPDKDLTLKLFSDRPGVQFYNAVWTDCPVPGIGGRYYGKHSGLCLEDQKFPGALAHAHFPSIVVTPDTPYRHWCRFEIG
ncbi:aldose epimerase family protein [Pelagibacterium xiamenense]|uniref:aldose epimerase family protein n=1 Tax=Pelagibacterium xiamenense TaxID=2901140 RepID=UPI001E29FE1C|nr:aldose epimerase family protein [Pelagibacterium xiamenense]MCD7058485.1 galactose mutarotase [Pelagibacterium xiamenense]